MTYINRVGHVSVSEDLWEDMIQVTELLAGLQDHHLFGQLSPEDRRVLSLYNRKWEAVLQRAREVDALHRRMTDAAARSTRDQIERGGDGSPYN